VQAEAMRLVDPEMADKSDIAPAVVEHLEACRPISAQASPAKRWLRMNGQALQTAVLGMISVGLFLLCWQILTANRVDLYVRFENVPSPADVLASIRREMFTAEFGSHLLVSCRRIFIGFALAAVLAIPGGLIMGRFRLIRAVVFPVTEIMRPIPAIAWVPMSIMLWPTSEESILFITFLGSFFPILINTLHGVDAVDPVLVRAAKCLGAGEIAIFREVYLPSALPQIFTGLTVGMGVAWVSLIAAEMISGQFGIGYFTWQAYSLVQYSDIALGMVTIGVLGLGSSLGLHLLGRMLMPWRAGR